MAPFDLVICDEEHRTTGVMLEDAAESNFVRVHDADYLHATRRLYMTATPRIYDETVKAKADEHSAEITSMDDETKYGPRVPPPVVRGGRGTWPTRRLQGPPSFQFGETRIQWMRVFS